MRHHLARIALALLLAGSLRADEQKSPEPAKAGHLLELRILATEKHDRATIAKAKGPDGLKHPPDGYRWVPLEEGFDLPDDGQLAFRTGPTGRSVLVKLDPQDITERDLQRVFETQGARLEPAVGFTLTRDAARRFGRLTREHLPEENGSFLYHLAIILKGRVHSAPTIRSEIRDQGIIEGLKKEEVSPLVDQLRRAAEEAREKAAKGGAGKSGP